MNPFAKHCLLGLAALLVAALPAAAGIGLWTPLGPDGAYASVLAVDPLDSDIVYAGTLRSGVFKSTDGGKSWTFAGLGLGTSVIQALAVDPVHPGTVYLSSSSRGLLKSTDGGGTWVQVWDGELPDNPGTFAAIYALALDPRRPGTVYAGTSAGVYRSTDGGATWEHRGDVTTAVLSLAVDSAGGWVYAGVTYSPAVYKSNDQGETWLPAGQGLPGSAGVAGLAIDPAWPQNLLAATLQGVYRSRDGGLTWKRGAGTPALPASVVAFQRRGRAYATFPLSGVYRSTDSGATWQRTLGRPMATGPFAALAVGPTAVYTGYPADPARPGVMRSLDFGATWEPSMRGLSGLGVRPIAVDPSNPRLLYTGAAGLFRSTSRGATWRQIDFGVRPVPSGIHDILIDPARPSRVYVTANDGPLLRSDDRGVTWERLDGGSVPAFLLNLAADPRTPEALWGTGTDSLANGLFHSADGGESWVRMAGLPVDPSFTALYVEVDPRDPRVVYLGGAQSVGSETQPRLFRSADGGATWERRDAGLASGSVSDIAFDAADPSTVYALTSGIYRSTDAGLTWQLLPARGRLFTSIATSPAVPGRTAALCATRWDIVHPSAVLCSTDRGATWTVLRRGLDTYTVLSLEIDPTDPRLLYVGTGERGLMTYTLP